MKMKITLLVFAILAFALCHGASAQPETPVPIPVLEGEFGSVQPDAKAKVPSTPKDKKTPDKKLTDPPATDLFTQTPVMGSQFSTGFNPHMMGDFNSFFVRQFFTVTGTQTTTTTTSIFNLQGALGQKKLIGTRTITTTTPFSRTQAILVPVARAAGAFKIAENESPRPVDRVFGTWNYFGGIQGPGNGPGSSVVNNAVVSNTAGFINIVQATSVNSVVSAAPRVNANLQREVVGFEKTFLDGYASIELRMPMLQQTSNYPGFGSQNVGDLTIIGKYAFILNNTTGNVLSAGMAITAPTGPGIATIDGNLHSTLIQPWFGYIWNADRFFVQAFHATVVPTDPRDVTLLFNDIGVNYWLYRGTRDQTLNFIVPMVEAHVTTPLNHRGANPLIYIPDTVIMTGGVHLGLVRHATLSLGAASPVTGPRIFNFEGFMQLNWRF